MSEKKKNNKFLKTITPKLRKTQTVNEQGTIIEQGGGLEVGTKIGDFSVNKNRIKENYRGEDFTEDSTDFGYNKVFDTRLGKIKINLKKGRRETDQGNENTRGGEISFIKTFKQGGLVKTGKPKLAKKGWK